MSLLITRVEGDGSIYAFDAEKLEDVDLVAEHLRCLVRVVCQRLPTNSPVLPIENWFVYIVNVRLLSKTTQSCLYTNDQPLDSVC